MMPLEYEIGKIEVGKFGLKLDRTTEAEK